MSATNGTHGPTGHQTDSDLDALYAWHLPQPAPQPLPEAPASVNVRVTIAGRDCQVTLRGMDELEVLARLERLLARYPVPQPSTPQAASQGEGYCHRHQVQMKWNAGKDGRQGWHSHRTADGWCQGRRA